MSADNIDTASSSSSNNSIYPALTQPIAHIKNSSDIMIPSAAAAAAVTSSSVGPIRNALRTAASATASISTRPLSGIFGINKPSGPTSMSLLDELKPLFATSPLFADADGKRSQDHSRKRGKFTKRGKDNKFAGGVAGAPKLGQGGTLDPLADGVLVVGVGNGTKQLQNYLNCTKEYRATGLLGSATTSYDSCDPILTRKPYHHVTPQSIADLLPRFTGTVSQIPPLYSAVRIDGKRLFEYARQNLPLPRPIQPRKVTIHELRLVDWLEAGQHSFKEPDTEVPEEDKALVGRVLDMTGRKEGQTDTIKEEFHVNSVEPIIDTQQQARVQNVSKTLPTQQDATATQTSTEPKDQHPPAFVLEMTVSSGTYVRSIVHDLATAAGSAAHVQTLTRTRQGEWSIASSRQTHTTADDKNLVVQGNCIDWKVFSDAIADMQREKTDASYKAPRDQQGLRSWECELLKVIVPV
ncbi:related to tRNA pseudouridine synthase B [Melanopsichium pennsylvanicum]|uniref:tRNA pseudouridine(55) synthase n=2 Tax=Melanopsichium pennsylvanicum TaxID=63383 RepID=A0AAJ4XTW6_9BASI|nr:related to tRNA pseudouridine synthase B [Melanopsichium pennsylvanicum 4]SNX87233.1 related to tRNA pseudouridine synthase B [Melanopsichium pennsylvanicum]